MTKPAFFKYEKYFTELHRKAENRMDNKYYWIWLSLAFGSNACTLSDKALHEFGYSAENVYNATEEMLKTAFPDNERLVRRLANKNLTQVQRILNICEQKNIGILTPGCFLYPKSLAHIPSRPMALYYKGCIPDFDLNLSVSIVGTRKVSQYGADAAYTIAYDVAKSGAIVISGMADGTDGIAHRGALDAMGKTVAVLGSGVDVIYPKSNTDLYNELILKGLIISEYPPGTAPEGWHFPQRNRIISGLASGTLIVEAAERSGALITAEYAKKQGKLLYAVPGKVGERASAGTNNLIRTGAKMTTEANDILSDFYPLYPTLKRLAPTPDQASPMPVPVVARPQKAIPVSTPVAPVPPIFDNSAEYMSIEVDPRLIAARKELARRTKMREGFNLTYPQEELTLEGYKVSSYWEPRRRTRKLPSIEERENASRDEEEAPIPTPTPKRRIAEAENEEEQNTVITTAKVKKQTTPNKAPETPSRPTVDLSKFNPNEKKIVEFLMGREKASMDEMLASGLLIHEIMGGMTLLEIQGIVESLPGGYYKLNVK